MKKMKILALLLGFVCFETIVNAQSGLTFEASQLFASFRFSGSVENTSVDNGGQLMDYSGIFTGAWGAGYRYVAPNGIMIRSVLGIRKAGATMVYDNMSYKWDLRYADARLGGGYMLRKKLVSPYLNVTGYYAYLLQGFQTINNEDFDIRAGESISKTDYGIFITPGVQFNISEAFASFIELNYIMGLQNLEKDEGQVSHNYACGISAGLAFSFGKKQ